MSAQKSDRVAADNQNRRSQLAAEVTALGLPVPGSLVERHTRCANHNCRCRTEPPELHGPYLTWTRKVNGKTVTRTLNPAQAEQIRPMLANSRRLREIVSELEALGLDHLINR